MGSVETLREREIRIACREAVERERESNRFAIELLQNQVLQLQQIIRDAGIVGKYDCIKFEHVFEK